MNVLLNEKGAEQKNLTLPDLNKIDQVPMPFLSKKHTSKFFDTFNEAKWNEKTEHKGYMESSNKEKVEVKPAVYK